MTDDDVRNDQLVRAVAQSADRELDRGLTVDVMTGLADLKRLARARSVKAAGRRTGRFRIWLAPRQGTKVTTLATAQPPQAARSPRTSAQALGIATVASSPLGYGEVPTAAARLVIVLLPVESEQPTGSIPVDTSITVAWPPLGSPSNPREAGADPEFATCYQAEMPALISFLIKCGANPGDAAATTQEAFRELFGQWKTVSKPKLWLRKAAFRIYLRRPMSNAASPEEDHDKLTSPGVSSRFDFGEEERLFSDLTRLLPTTQRAVLALHYERFQTLDIAEILGMKPTTVRRNLKQARATLKASLNLDDNT
jgi:RNA polymerase sigma factor (sigma-70 family)